ncbi:MAG: ATP-dependent DNA helicase [Bacteroidota bacterium]
MSDLRTTVHSIFSPTGRLSHLPHFEFRPQQQQMALAIADSLDAQSHLIVEAPTGVGKTIAYLLPSLLFALGEERKAIISTHTKNLQDQIILKDIPLIREMIDEPFRAVAMKGRRNYLCTSRLVHALASSGSLFGDDATDQLKRIHEWSLDSENGDVESLGFSPDPLVWDMVCSEKGLCSSALCSGLCFFQRSKERARSADVIIMNHALFFSLMALHGTEERFVFDNDFVVFDEAHTLEGVAGSGIGKRLTRYQVIGALHKLYNRKTRKGLLARDARQFKGAIERVEKSCMEFFDLVRQAALSMSPQTTQSGQYGRSLRIRTPHVVVNSLSESFRELMLRLQEAERSRSSEPEKKELEGIRRSLWEADILIDEFLEQPEPSFTYWIEFGGARSEHVTLCASPTHVADTVGPMLFAHDSPAIMTSATLSVGGSLDYFQRRIGAQAVRGVILDSPFDFPRQMKICLARGMPEPDNPEYVRLLPQFIRNSIARSNGKALVLFTNATLMERIAKELADTCDENGWRLLVQGSEHQRHELLEIFKQDVHSVLFGLDSFWGGVDVPGEALEHVIITRLPFAMPGHPLIESRLEAITRSGGNAFMEYSLPEAVLKLRQGVGRLIRSGTDRGIVTILDARVLTRRYGEIFLRSLPRCQIEILTPDGELEPLLREEY